MGSYIRLVVTLTAIAAAASFGLSAVYNATHEITEEYKRLETENARIEVLPTEGGEFFEETTTDSVLDGREFVYYTALRKRGPRGRSRIHVHGLREGLLEHDRDHRRRRPRRVDLRHQDRRPEGDARAGREGPGGRLEEHALGRHHGEWRRRGRNEAVVPGAVRRATERRTSRSSRARAQQGILAITGATISSETVTSSVRRGLTLLVSIVGVGRAGRRRRAGGHRGAGRRLGAGGSPARPRPWKTREARR